MVRFAALASLAVLAVASPALAAKGGDVPKEPGVWWEQSMEMQMTGFAVPPTTSKICLPKKGLEEPPPAGDDQKCKITDQKRTGNRMTWKVKCEGGVSGEGDITSGPESYSGTMLMRIEGNDMRMKMKGKKLGGDCDANEMKRTVAKMQDDVETAQANQAKQAEEACAQAAEDVNVGAFVSPYAGVPVQCNDPARFCANLETRRGVAALRRDEAFPGARKKAEKLCKKDLAAIEKKLCADEAKRQEKKLQLADEDAADFIVGACPDLAKTLAKRECAGRKFTALPQAQREFCVRWSQQGLSQPADAEPVPAKGEKRSRKAAEPEEDEAAPPQAEDMKSRIMKGIFGR